MYKFLFKNCVMFECITQNYLIFYQLKNFDIVSSIHFHLLNKSFDELYNNFFNKFFFLEWFSCQKPFVLFNSLVSSCRRNQMLNFFVFFEIFLSLYDNIKNIKFNPNNCVFSFEIKSYRRIPVLHNFFYNLDSILLIQIFFDSVFFSLLSYAQKKNFLIFFFNRNLSF